MAMADNHVTSPLRRARIGVEIWLDLLPEEARLDAKIALDKLCQIAEREIDSAYSDGSNNNWNGRRAEETRKALAKPAEQSVTTVKQGEV
ncbi:hypothetical protein [Bradyrhizobium sp. USDA 4452]